MGFDHGRPGDRKRSENPASSNAAPGKTTLTAALPAIPRRAAPEGSASRAAPAAAPSGGPAPFGAHVMGAVQRLERDSASGADVHAAAARGVAAPSTEVPHAAAIQASFGSSFDVSGLQAHVGGAAAEACDDMGARAFAAGDHVAFARAPDLHEAAHEAAHAAQQARGVSLRGGVGEAGDAHEQHADQVADLVVQGRSAAHLVGGDVGSAPAGGGAVQRIVSTDGLGQRIGVVKKLDAYNASLLKLLDGPKRDITQDAVTKLAAQLRPIQQLLISKVVGLPDEQRLPLKQAVADELRELMAARDDLQKLGALRAPRLAQGDDHQGIEEQEAPNVDEGNDPVDLDQGGGGGLELGGGGGLELGGGGGLELGGGGGLELGGGGLEVGGGGLEVGGGGLEVGGGGGDLVARTKEEDHTRIGFEIELGTSYSGNLDVFDAVDAVVNETLFEFVNPSGRVMLEMLLDDSKKESLRSVFQVEFRTPPLELQDIKPSTRVEIKNAIGAFRAPTAFDSRQSLGKGWRRTERCNNLIAQIGDGGLTTSSRFSAPPRLAQHVTSSINVGSYTRLNNDQQQVLYKHGRGSRRKIDLYKRILGALGSGTIDATTGGRNTGKHLVKSPIEAMLAAEEALELEGGGGLTHELASEERPEQVSNSDEHRYGIRDLTESVEQIKHDGSYPTMQGQPGGTGYLAKAEKLQAPLLDPRNRQLRVLVEHRTDDLFTAVNDVLNGKPSKVWDEFVKAVQAMDDQR